MSDSIFAIRPEPEIVAYGETSWKRDVSRESSGVIKVNTVISFSEDTALVSARDIVDVSVPDGGYKWTPALCPEENDVIGDHIFRSPAVILQNAGLSFALIPDIVSLGHARKPRHSVNKDGTVYDVGIEPGDIKAFMTMTPDDKGLGFLVSYGFAEYDCRSHVYYRLNERPVVFKAGESLEISYYILSGAAVRDDLRAILAFIWDRFASKYAKTALPQKRSFEDYAGFSMQGVLKADEYHEADLPSGAKGGGFTRATITCERLKDGIGGFNVPVGTAWFFEWWNSLRTAFGAKYHADISGDAGWTARAGNVKNLILSAPDDTGLGVFPALYDFGSNEWWNGVPGLGADRDVFDTAAFAHTATWLIRWNRYLEKDEAMRARIRKIAETAVRLVRPDGSFPSFIYSDGSSHPLLADSAQGAMLSLFLCEFYEDEKEQTVLDAVLKSCEYYRKKILPPSKFHDFELFFSCSPKQLDFFDRRAGQHGQNNLCLSWLAEMFLKVYEFTNESAYLETGVSCLDKLSLYQQSWSPPYLSFYSFGGFGVMNTDGEWNDTRQVYFSNIYFLAWKITGNREYLERGTAALRAGCALLCCPDHADINPMAYKTYHDGLCPESFGHNGQDGRVYRSGFDWGGGALIAMSALTALKYPEIYRDINALK